MLIQPTREGPWPTLKPGHLAGADLGERRHRWEALGCPHLGPPCPGLCSQPSSSSLLDTPGPMQGWHRGVMHCGTQAQKGHDWGGPHCCRLEVLTMADAGADPWSARRDPRGGSAPAHSLPPRLNFTKLQAPERAHSGASVDEGQPLRGEKNTYLAQRNRRRAVGSQRSRRDGGVVAVPAFLAPGGGGRGVSPVWGNWGGCRAAGQCGRPQGPVGTGKAPGHGGHGSRSVSIKSLKWQLALKLIPDWSRVGSHVELMMQLRAAAPPAVLERGGGAASNKRGFRPCYVSLIFEFYLRLLFPPLFNILF